MTDFLKVDLSGRTERKGNLTYLSWCEAWTEVLKADPEATWDLIEYEDADGVLQPCMWLPDESAVVKVSVTIEGRTRTAVLPVMNNRNQAVKQPDAFAINTAIMRCLTKAIAMFGLGLYIYAGEDMPEGETPAPKAKEPERKPEPSPPAATESKPRMPTQDDRDAYARGLARARERGLDLAAYEIDGRTTREELLELGRKLKVAVDTQAAQQTTMNGVA